MGMTDPIADMLTRIRNANKARFKTVRVSMSQVNVNVAGVLKKTGYITNYEKVKDEKGRQMPAFSVASAYWTLSIFIAFPSVSTDSWCLPAL